MKFEFDNYPRAVAMLIVIGMVFSNNHLPLTTGQVVGFLVMLGVGVVIFYSIFFLITTTIIWLTNVFNLEEFFDSILSVGKYPVYVFDKGLRFVFFFILPAAYISTFPIDVLRGRAGWDRIGLGIILASVFLFISNRFWHFALRHYSSASS